MCASSCTHFNWFKSDIKQTILLSDNLQFIRICSIYVLYCMRIADQRVYLLVHTIFIMISYSLAKQLQSIVYNCFGWLTETIKFFMIKLIYTRAKVLLRIFTETNFHCQQSQVYSADVGIFTEQNRNTYVLAASGFRIYRKNEEIDGVSKNWLKLENVAVWLMWSTGQTYCVICN